MSQPHPIPLIHPVILCGGSGTRLWPVSRQSYPKQFCRLTGPSSLFQETVRRYAEAGFGSPVIVTGEAFRFIVTEQLAEIGVEPAAILVEPQPRNTGPAILAATLWIEKHKPGALLMVAPSDHHLPDADGFRQAVLRAGQAAAEGGIVLFGITPSRPDTGYGYLELDHERPGNEGPLVHLRCFVEKPDHAIAAVLATSGQHLWNAGMLLARTDAIMAAYRQHAPAMLEPVAAAMAGACAKGGFTALSPEPWTRCLSISVDYAILEKADGLRVMPYGGAGSDLGGWDAVWAEDAAGPRRLALHGAVTAVDCANSLLHAGDGAMQLVAIGVRDLIAVATPDAVLVADAARAQEVRLAVEALRRNGARQAETSPRAHRPWGHFEVLVSAPGFQVKRIVVRPGAALSLQSHRHRNEHWVVAEGEAAVTLDGRNFRLTTNESIDIPRGGIHRLVNPGTMPLTVIEVQTGDYFGEDDIVRHEDVYARA